MRDARTLLAVAAHSYFTGQLSSAVQYVAVGLSEEDHCLLLWAFSIHVKL